MNLIEAFHTAKSGKRIAFNNREAMFVGGSLRWVDNGLPDTYVTMDDSLLDGWELASVVTHDFENAFQMMKSGEWMRPVGMVAWCRKSPVDGGWESEMDLGRERIKTKASILETKWLDQKWEARP